MRVALLIDFGSTYTKIRAVDIDRAMVVGSAQAPSTVHLDVTIGLEKAYDFLLNQMKITSLKPDLKLACSSAAGGLRMVAIGLVTELTAEAAKRAALGAGAKVVRLFSYKLSRSEMEELETLKPDIVLLSGGTDGGDRDTVMQNASLLACSCLQTPIIVACNKSVCGEVSATLCEAGKSVHVVDNVMPELNRLNVEPCRSKIREIFMQQIVRAKGLQKAEQFVDNIIMPTPMATLNAARLLADGTTNEAGMGELMVIEVGGATTNVHSISTGNPTQADLIPKGLPEPYAKRTVEGDLGIRYNALHLVEIAGKGKVLRNMAPEHRGVQLEKEAQELSVNVNKIPTTEAEFAIDVGLARTAVDIATDRHAGAVEVVQTPTGPVKLLHGKDLTYVSVLIGTGGVFAYGKEPQAILEAALFNTNNPLSLRPRNPVLYLDHSYIMYAAGLLNTVAPDKAYWLMRNSLMKLS